MSESLITKADATVEAARTAAQETAAALDRVAAATDAANAEATHLESLDALTQDDLLATENVRRRLRVLDAEYVAATAAHAAALAALDAADKAAHRAHMHEAHAEALALVAPIEKSLAKFIEKATAQVQGLRERVAVAAEHAAAAGEPVPYLPGIGARLAAVDATDEAAVLLALGSALTAEREHAAFLAELDRDAAERDRQEAERAAARAAFDALPDEEKEARRLAQFDEAVDRLAIATGSDPARLRGFSIDTLRRMVAASLDNPFPRGRNPYVPVLVEVPVAYDPSREMDAIATRHHDALAAAQAEREAAGIYDPFSKDRLPR